MINSIEFMSPELLITFFGNKKENDSNLRLLDKEKCDVFALGLIILKAYYC